MKTCALIDSSVSVTSSSSSAFIYLVTSIKGYFLLLGFFFLVTLCIVSESLSRAKTNVKLVPLPHTETKLISPPNYWMIFFEICRPRPIPLVLNYLDDSKKPNNSNNLSLSLSWIPMPVSETDIWIIPCLAALKASIWCRNSRSYSDLINLHFNSTFPPYYVNLSAFDCKFSKTCWILYLSLQIKLSFSKPSKTAKRSTSRYSALSFWI